MYGNKMKMRILVLTVVVVILAGCGEKAVSPEQFTTEVTESESLKTVAEPWHTSQEPEADISVTENPYENSQYELLDEGRVVCYYDPKGKPKLKLYYDRETGQGCGLKYEEAENGTDLLGFKIDGYYPYSSYWNFPNPYSAQIVYTDGAAPRVDRVPRFLYEKTAELEEIYTYDQENKLCAYQLRGCVRTEEGKTNPEELVTVSYFYRENGALQEKLYLYNEEVFGRERVGGNQHYVYDERERLLYVEFEYPEAMGNYYLIYEGDSMIPAAYLEQYNRFSTFVQLKEQDYHNRIEVPRDGVEAFLSQTGLSPQDKLHEYQWHNESSADTVIWSHSDVILTLYFDPEKELGCGYLDYPGEEFVDMSGFMFKGCMEIDGNENDPYRVFARYEGDSMEEIVLGSLSPEQLPEAFPHESLYICEYDEERLMRIWMYGTGSDTERFFIYDGDSDLPSYCLNLVSGFTHGATLFKFVY